MTIWGMSMFTYLAIGLLICAVGMFVIGATGMLDSFGENFGIFPFVTVSLFAWPIFAIPLAVAALVAVLAGFYKLGQKFSRPRKENLELSNEQPN